MMLLVHYSDLFRSRQSDKGLVFELVFDFFFFLVLCRPDMTFAVDWALNNNYLSSCFVFISILLDEEGHSDAAVQLLLFI